MFRLTTIRSKVMFMLLIFLMLFLMLTLVSVTQIGQIGQTDAALLDSDRLRAITVVLLFSFTLLVFGVSVGAFLARSIAHQLSNTVELAKHLAAGEHDLVIDASCPDETGRFLRAMQQMAQLLHETQQALFQQTDKLTRASDTLKEEMTKRDQIAETLRQYAQNVIDSSLDMIIAVDSDRKIIEFNKAAQRAFGYPHDEIIGQHVDVLYADREEAAEVYHQTVKTGQFVKEITNKRKNGAHFPCLLAASILYDARGLPIGFMGISRDITDQKHTEETLRQHNRELKALSELNELLQACHVEKETYQMVENIFLQLFPADVGYLAMIDHARSGLRIVNAWGNLRDLPERFELDDCWAVRRGKIHHVAPPETGPVCRHIHTAAPHGYLCTPISAAGELLGILHLSFGCAPSDHVRTDENGELVGAKYLIVRRIVDHYALSLGNLRLRETLKQDAIRDALTGMYNRRYVDGTLEREARRAERRHSPVGIMMLDVDYFKMFNDTHGHDAGDVILREIGLFLRQNTRGEDIACRYGGEEFLLVLPDATLEATRERAEILRQGLERLQIVHQDNALHLTVSIGVAALPEHGPEIRHAVKAADVALYQAKDEGRNRVVAATVPA